jgi:hypothetical protein
MIPVMQSARMDIILIKALIRAHAQQVTMKKWGHVMDVQRSVLVVGQAQKMIVMNVHLVTIYPIHPPPVRTPAPPANTTTSQNNLNNVIHAIHNAHHV